MRVGDERTEHFLNLGAKLSRLLNEWRQELSPEEIDTMNELRMLISDRFEKEAEQAREA